MPSSTRLNRNTSFIRLLLLESPHIALHILTELPAKFLTMPREIHLPATGLVQRVPEELRIFADSLHFFYSTLYT